MMKKVTIPCHIAVVEYRTVWQVLDYKDGYVWNTKQIGYAKADRPRKENEIYSSLSTSITRNKETVTLELVT